MMDADEIENEDLDGEEGEEEERVGSKNNKQTNKQDPPPPQGIQVSKERGFTTHIS